MSDSSPPEWEEFRASVARLAELPADRVRPEDRIVEDLGFDSIQLTELVVMLVGDCGLEGHRRGIESRSWTGVTVGALFDETR